MGVFGITTSAAAAPVAGPEINPYACQGQVEVAQSDRSISQVGDELDKKMDPILEGWEQPTQKALKYCVVGMLKARLGHGDAAEYFEKAIAENPDEPGYEFFLGRYYGGARGARGTALEMAEKHYYRALDKLENLKKEGRYRDFHKVIEDHTRKGLLVLYQQDGLPLLPWKAFPQHSNGYMPPSISVGSEFHISQDTRDGPGANEVGGFSAEIGLKEVRTGIDGTDPEKFTVARNPLRYRINNKIRLRQTYVGAVDLTHMKLHGEKAAFCNFADLSESNLCDVDVTELGVGFERQIPLYPVLDFKLAGGVKHVSRKGTVEWFPNYEQNFFVYEAKPAVSRFIGSDKLTIGFVYAYMDIPPLSGMSDGQNVCPVGQEARCIRGRTIWAANVEYAFYSPLLLPSFHLGSLRPYRTPTRGLYLNAGYVNDNEVFGPERTINHTIYGAVRLEGPGPYDIGVTESYYVSNGYGPPIDPVTRLELPGEELKDNRTSHTLRSQFTIARRLVNPDATPGVPESVGPFASDTLNLVFPLSWDKALANRNYFENFRVGTQLWWKVFGTGLWGATLLTTVGYDYQYFYNINKHMHNAGLTVRLGWGDL